MACSVCGDGGCWASLDELWATLFVIGSGSRRSLVGPRFYSKNLILLVPSLEPSKHLHWLCVLERDTDSPGLVTTAGVM